MRRLGLSLLSMAGSLALLACGGGGSTTAQAPVATAPAPTPTPTPTPVPPSLVYDLASDFARDRSFNAIGVRVSAAAAASGATSVDERLDMEGSAIGFDFTAAGRAYRARYNADMLTIATVSQPSGTGFNYDLGSQPTVRFVRSPGAGGGGGGSTYVGVVDWSDNAASAATQRYLVFGARTLASDLPAGGSVTYTGNATIGGAGGSVDQAATITIDFASRTVTIATTYQLQASGAAGSGMKPAPVMVALSGTLDRESGRIGGTVALGSGSGTFEGAAYGPMAAEIGLALKVPVDGSVKAGFIVARR